MAAGLVGQGLAILESVKKGISGPANNGAAEPEPIDEQPPRAQIAPE
jgi:hypothetical protein